MAAGRLPTHLERDPFGALELSSQTESLLAPGDTIFDLRGAKTSGGRQQVDRLQKACLAGTVGTQEEMTPRPGMPICISQIAK